MMGNVYEAQVAADKARTHLRIGFWIATIPAVVFVVGMLFVFLFFGMAAFGS